MELWIRSQGKTILAKCDDIAYRLMQKGDDNNNLVKEHQLVGYFNKNDDYEILGTYKTKERALGVLDEIQNLLKPKITYNLKEPVETISEGIYVLKQETDMKIQEINRIVYEMPRE